MRCTSHAGGPAAFHCNGCGSDLCVDCAARDFINGAPVVRCVRCRGLAVVLRAPVEILPWWRMLPAFASAIVSRAGFVRIVALAVALYAVSVLCDLASHIFVVGGAIALAVGYLLGGGLRVGAYFMVIRSAAFGGVELPDTDDFRGWWEDVFAPLFRFTLATALVWAPAVAWIAHRRGIGALLEPEPLLSDPFVVGLIAAGILYFPAAILAAAIGQETLPMLNPFVTLRMIFRMPGAYLGTLAFLIVCLVVDGVVDLAFLRAEARVRLPVVVPLVGEAAGILVPLLASMVLGRLVYQNAERIGFLDADDLTAPAVPGAEPRGVLSEGSVLPAVPGAPAAGPPGPRPPSPPAPTPAPSTAALRLALERGDDDATRAAYRALASTGAELGLDAAHELRLASWLERAGAVAEATDACRRAVRADPEGPLAARAVFTFARLLADGLGDPAGAAEAYRLLLERYPYDPLVPQAESALRRLGA